jgi:hypothetical protein
VEECNVGNKKCIGVEMKMLVLLQKEEPRRGSIICYRHPFGSRKYNKQKRSTGTAGFD